jgi:hypothetical protein
MTDGDDYLAALPVQQVAAWYRRLADHVGKERIDGQEPLASRFLRHWLDNRNPTYEHPERQDAVRPQDRFIRVYHTKARRLEQAGLAAPYDLVSTAQRVAACRVFSIVVSVVLRQPPIARGRLR